MPTTNRRSRRWRTPLRVGVGTAAAAFLLTSCFLNGPTVVESTTRPMPAGEVLGSESIWRFGPAGECTYADDIVTIPVRLVALPRENGTTLTFSVEARSTSRDSIASASYRTTVAPEGGEVLLDVTVDGVSQSQWDAGVECFVGPVDGPMD